MSFPEYLKGRISEDYKNLVSERLAEIRSRAEELKKTAPSLLESQQSLRDVLQNELSRVQEIFDSELDTVRARMITELFGAIDSYVHACYQTNGHETEERLDAVVSDIVTNLPQPPKEANQDVKLLAELMTRLDDANTQGEILNQLLHQIAAWVDRAILFVIKGETAGAWAALGLNADWTTSRVREVSVNLNKDTILRAVVDSSQAAYGSGDEYPDNRELFLMIGTSIPRTVLACPVIVRARIAGILYADLKEDLSMRPDLPDLLYLACRVAGAAIDLLAMRSKQVIVREPAVAGLVEHKIQEHVTPQLLRSVPLPQEEEQEQEEDISGEAPTVMMPAPTLILSPDVHKLHEDARRFARLLVSEIKLYNEAQVSAGREHRDLYDRLKDDIERSRKSYMERVPAHVQSATNYFYEELVRTLANGDPSLLGM